MNEAMVLLGEITPKINEQIKVIVESEFKKSKGISPQVDEFIEEYSTVALSDGKRLRGAFVYYSYLLCGGSNKTEILKISAAIELIHAYLLVHDDVQDKAKKRRGVETINEKYSKYSLLDKYNSHFGNSVAINAGDILNHLGLQALIDSAFNEKLKLKAITKLNRRISDVVYGQVMDNFGEMLSDVDEEYILNLYHYKTGLYTYDLPIQVGAILAGASLDQMANLHEYSVPGGVAFQIVDDILDLFSNEVKLGKTIGKDIKEGKKTLLILKALENCEASEKNIIKQSLGNKNLIENQIDQIKEIIKSSGSLEYSKSKAKLLLDQSTKAISTNSKQLGFDRQAQEFFIGINEYMYNRDF